MHLFPITDLEVLRLSAQLRRGHVYSLCDLAAYLRHWLRDERYTDVLLRAHLHGAFRYGSEKLQSGSSNTIVPLCGELACRVLTRRFAFDAVLTAELCEEMRHATRVHAAGGGLPLFFFGLVDFPSMGPYFVSCWPLGTPAWSYVVGRPLRPFGDSALAAIRAMSDCVLHLDCTLSNMVVIDAKAHVVDFESHFAVAVRTAAELAASRRYVPVLMCVTQACAAPLGVCVFSLDDVAGECAGGSTPLLDELHGAALGVCYAFPGLVHALVRILCQYVTSGMTVAPDARAFVRVLRRHGKRSRGFDRLVAAGAAPEYLRAFLCMAVALVPATRSAELKAAEVREAVATLRLVYAEHFEHFFEAAKAVEAVEAVEEARPATKKRPGNLALESPDLVCHSPALVADSPVSVR
jgi:hypothetical protein